MHDDYSALDLLRDAYLVLDAHGHVIAANESYLLLSAQSRDEVLGKPVFACDQGDAGAAGVSRRATLRALLAQLASEGVAESGTIRCPMRTARDGVVERFWKLFGNVRRAAGADDRRATQYILRVEDVTAGHLRDLAQRKQQAMLRSTAQLRQRVIADAQRKSEQDTVALQEALAFARIGAWVLDLETGIIECTAQCKANYGMSEDYLMTHDSLLNDLIDPVDRDRVRAVLHDAVGRRDSFDVEYRTTWPSGETRWVMVRGRFPDDDDGTALRISGFSLDITGRKLLELENEARIKVESDARRLSEDRVNSMDTFVSAVSHELRSPLNAIGSWAQLLDRPDKIALPHAASVIQRNVRQLSAMIEDLLDTGAVIHGKLGIALEPVDLSEIVRDVAEDSRLTVEAKGLGLMLDIQNGCAIMGDAKRLRQVVFNLLTNAVKFTETGGIAMSLVSTVENVFLSIKDSGIGISAEKLGGIFDRFNQVATVDARRGGGLGGLGLGLWISKTIVAEHGGVLTVESDGEQCGSTFTVQLPCIAADARIAQRDL